MQKVDLIITGVGIAALVATVLGVVLYEDGNQTIFFPTEEVKLQNLDGVVEPAPKDFFYALPNNATSGTFSVDVSWAGQTLAAGQSTVLVEILAPNSTRIIASDTKVIALEGGTTSGGLEAPIVLDAQWADIPGSTRGTEESVNETLDWGGHGITIRVSVSEPASLNPPAPVAAQPITFTAKVTGTVSVYEEATRLPDVDAGA